MPALSVRMPRPAGGAGLGFNLGFFRLPLYGFKTGPYCSPYKLGSSPNARRLTATSNLEGCSSSGCYKAYKGSWCDGGLGFRLYGFRYRAHAGPVRVGTQRLESKLSGFTGLGA